MNFIVASFVSLLCYVLVNVCRFHIMLVRLVREGGLANLYGMVCATCMRGMGVMVPFEVPSIASESAMSFPLIHVWALTFLDCYFVSEPCYVLTYRCC